MNVKMKNNDNLCEKIGYLERFLQFFKKIFLIYPSYLVMVLWLSELALSTLKIMVDIPESYFSNKRNFLNQFFVKWAWGWTLIITGLYMILTSFVHGGDSWKKSVLCSVLRLAFATMLWYFWVNIVFRFVQDLTGVCLDNHNRPNFDIVSMKDCIKLKQGHIWDGFDISGHAFLLTFCILLMNSELQLQRNWSKIPTNAVQFYPIGSKSLVHVKSKYRASLNSINILFILNCCFMCLWFVMVIFTCLYFHSFYSKAIGCSCAIFSWMISYNEWYKCSLSPGVPGNGPLCGLFLKVPSKSS